MCATITYARGLVRARVLSIVVFSPTSSAVKYNRLYKVYMEIVCDTNAKVINIKFTTMISSCDQIQRKCLRGVEWRKCS